MITNLFVLIHQQVKMITFLNLSSILLKIQGLIQKDLIKWN